MKFRPGKKLLRYFAVMVALSAATFIVPALTWLVVTACLCLIPLVVLEFRHLKATVADMSVVRSTPGLVARGKTFKVVIEITTDTPGNRKAVIRDEIPVLGHSEQLTHELDIKPGLNQLSYYLTIPQRGLHHFGILWLRISGGYGLLEVQRGWVLENSIKVLPPSMAPDDELAKNALDERRLLDQMKQTHHRGEGTEFESLSEYREGDDIRRINWRSSARYNHLIVRRFQVERHRDVMILLDCGRLMGTAVGNGTKMDCAVDAALVISRVALSGGDRCGVGVFDNQVRGFLSPVAGVSAHKTLIDRLYDVKASWRETDFGPMFAMLQKRQAKRSFIIILSDMMEKETTERYRAALMSLKSRHVVLFAALRTPLLAETVKTPIGSAQDVARETFALRLMREREGTLHTLKHGGIGLLDVEPSELNVPLINMFLESRERTVA